MGRNWITGPLDVPLGRGVNFEIAVATIAPVLGALAEAGWPLFMAPETRSWSAARIEPMLTTTRQRSRAGRSRSRSGLLRQ